MEPKIVFLGTGGDSVVVGKQLRASGGIIIAVSDYQFWIDPGPGALVRALQYNINVRETTAILVSHAHVNHATDLNAVISGMTYNGLDVHGVLVANETVVNGDGKESPVLTRFHRGLMERVITAHPDQKIGIEEVEIRTLKAKHSDEHTIGFKIITPNFVLSYSADTAYDKDIADQYKDSDILILNVVHPAGTETDNNLTVGGAIQIVQSVKPKLTVLTHFGSKLLQEDPIQAARNIQHDSSSQVIAAKDGMVVNPENYSSNQQTLNSY